MSHVSGGRLRVVVVDNDPSALELAALDLSLEGHQIVGRGTNGEDAIRLVAETAPQVLVIDHRMPPGRTGAAVAEQMAIDHPEVFVIVYTNYQDASVIEAVRASGARYVPKGNLRTLRGAVAEAES